MEIKGKRYYRSLYEKESREIANLKETIFKQKNRIELLEELRKKSKEKSDLAKDLLETIQ